MSNTGQPLLGTFIKTPSVHVVEILGAAGFDFLVIDAEHAAFDRHSIDLALLAARAAGVHAVVRVRNYDATEILAALDDGADGVLVPHISSREQAKALVRACRYSSGRGFSNSPRAGAYGATAMWRHVDNEDERVAVIAMIEDPSAVESIEEILSVDGIDAIFIGRGDLTVAMADREAGAPSVQAAANRVIEAAVRHAKPVWLLPSSAEEAVTLTKQQVKGFIVSSDQGLLRSVALKTLREFRAPFDKM
ncbi:MULTISPECIES: HpcH/HpaI aldolase family protein [unclassified Burkholderia]|uniref:HpcH/HpaI aldolase family protein n=1 Tax=unclassified Burkholderia TaxID=2613784 RepID=UPI002AB1F8AE|nr:MULTISPECIES: aldolase/citrate lyase family protein [unclassified Burkholderia]